MMDHALFASVVVAAIFVVLGVAMQILSDSDWDDD